MARAGIYKSEVVKARDRLLAMGRHPSIDAVRQELGNTGSKGTIHRYLKEIEEEEGVQADSKVAVSDAIQDLVARLAERLRFEADTRIEELKGKHAKDLADQRQAHEATQNKAAGLQQALEQVERDLAEERARHQRTSEQLQQEITAHAVVLQQVSDLGDRLRVEEEHRRSLEEKHKHAREALEHFRTASKEQREQEQRQHEQQVQYLQGEIRSLRESLVEAQHEAIASKQVSARLASDLAQSERALSEAKEEMRSLKNAKAELVSAQRQMERLGRQVVALQASVEERGAQNLELETLRAADQAQIQQLQVDLAAAKAALEAQNQLAEKIQGWITQKPHGVASAPASEEVGK